MTKVEIFRKNGNIIGYKASGHSGYSEQGSDIICSAISTSLQMTLIGIQEVLKLKVDFKINVENWYPEKLFSPKYVKTVGRSLEIKINHESLQSLSGELKNSIADLEMALSILNKAETYNNELSSRKENRKETLGQYVADHLKQIQVLDMIGKIDSFFADLDTKKGKYANFSGYNGTYFFTKFNILVIYFCFVTKKLLCISK